MLEAMDNHEETESLGVTDGIGGTDSLGRTGSLDGTRSRDGSTDSPGARCGTTTGIPSSTSDTPPAPQPSDLLAALTRSRSSVAELKRRVAELEQAHGQVTALSEDLAAELEETNRGVVALYSEEHQFAVTLQRTFLPDSLPDLPGVELAVRYLPAASQSEIGGDFYEAVETPEGLLLAVGDVAGHSLQAAIVMGELRHALRAYASEGHPPNVLLSLLDGLLVQHRPGWTATLCIVLVEPGTGRIHIANAGHLPPLLMPSDGAARYLHDHGPLLGLGLSHPTPTTHHISPGARLLMVTDGLIEIPGAHIDRSLQELSDAVVQGPQDSQTLCDTLLETFAGRQIDDIVIFTAVVKA